MTTVGIIGGTGPQGRGLGFRFARGGYSVILGSRSVERAQEATLDIERRLDGSSVSVRGAQNSEAAARCDIAVLAVPWDGHRELLQALRAPLVGKVVVSCVNPLGFDKRGPFALAVPEGSAAEQAAAELPDSRVVASFHHVSAVNLLGEQAFLDHEDVLVCGDDVEAKQAVCDLASTITGHPGIDAGALRLAHQLESMTAVLISINKRYRARSGIRITNLP